jgi:hypothetical protein
MTANAPCEAPISAREAPISAQNRPSETGQGAWRPRVAAIGPPSVALTPKLVALETLRVRVADPMSTISDWRLPRGSEPSSVLHLDLVPQYLDAKCLKAVADLRLL